MHFNKELTHGEFLIKSEVKQAIMEEIRGMLAHSGSAVVGLARPVLQTTVTLARTGLGALGAMPAVQLHRSYAGRWVALVNSAAATSVSRYHNALLTAWCACSTDHVRIVM